MELLYLKQQAAEAAIQAVELRRELHRWPEAGNQEFRTVKIIEKELKNLGLTVQYPLPTGLLCTILCKESDRDNSLSVEIGKEKGIALRADIDGLPIKERLRLPFSSSVEGFMHACGHDVHTAILLGTAKVIANNRHLLNQDVKLLFQPAEETTGGAERMIAAGCLRNPDIESVYGLHIKPELLAGQVGFQYGRVHAASDMFRIGIKGRSSHGASPEKGVDALLTGCQVVSSLQTAVSRSTGATDPAVLTVGAFHSGTAGNIISDEANFEGTIRSFDPEVSSVLRQRIEDIVKYTALASGGEGRVTFLKGYPAVINDKTATDRLVQLARELIGSENLIEIKKPSMSVEDFSFYLHKAKGSFFFLGSGFPHRENPPIHSDNLYINEDCIETGILLMSALCFL
ncbi:MAG: M20 family metallopeptidase [Anaerovoracaceae bacterium]